MGLLTNGRRVNILRSADDLILITDEKWSKRNATGTKINLKSEQVELTVNINKQKEWWST